MTTIKASCPTCAEVELTASQIELKVHPRADRSFYAFACPKCQSRVEKPADDQIIALLLSGGVQSQVIEVPQEVFEIEQAQGPSLTLDDLIELHFELDRLDQPGWTELLRSRHY